MNIIVPDEEVEEISIEDAIRNNDKAKIIIKGENVGKRGPENDELTKELAAHDALSLGSIKAGQIHDISQPSANSYSKGEHVKDEDAKSRVLAARHNIAEVATAKLMESLNLFDPTCIEKEIDRAKAAGILAGVVEKVTGGGKGTQQVQLVLYAPKQVNIDKYEVIEV